jgi:hypothetical protein
VVRSAVVVSIPWCVVVVRSAVVVSTPWFTKVLTQLLQT